MRATPAEIAAAEIAAAEQAGRDAYHRGAQCDPCHDPVMCGTQPGALMAEDRAIGEGIPLLEAWSRGWTDENLKAPVPGWTDEENAAIARAQAETAEEIREACRYKGSLSPLTDAGEV